MTIEIREGRGVGDAARPHPPAPRAPRARGHPRAPARHRRDRAHLRRRRRHQGADPGAADRALQHGRHPLQRTRRSRDALADGNPTRVVPGLMAVGEAACVSVHGANRLGSNSLLDLVVFGREAARHCAAVVKPGAAQKPLRARCGRRGAGAPRPAAQRQWRAAARREIRLEMQKIMQSDAAVFRTGESLQRRRARSSRATFASFADVRVSDRGLIWNTDLVETLELDNLLLQATATINSAANRTGEPRRACARGFPGARRRELAEAHAVLGRRPAARRASTTARCT